MPLLEIQDLVTAFHTPAGRVTAVDGISLSIERGMTLGLVGESGCGKSVTAMSVLGLVAAPGRVERGRILLEIDGDPVNLATLPESRLRRMRGGRVGMIFQEPMTSLNPVFTIGNQVAEAVRLHRRASWREARARALELLRLVRIADPERRLDEYPHQLSGGMRQRIMIAIALACEPELLIADEPTTALDVTIQAQILELIADLRQSTGTAVVLVTHDLGVVAGSTDRVAVMYAGRIVETGATEAVFARPQHPYTRGLLASTPRIDTPPGSRLEAIPGLPPDLGHLPSGCPFHPRCGRVVDRCREEDPSLTVVSAAHAAACWNSEATA